MDIKITKPEGIVLTLSLSSAEASELLTALDYAARNTLMYTAADRLISALVDANVQQAEDMYE